MFKDMLFLDRSLRVACYGGMLTHKKYSMPFIPVWTVLCLGGFCAFYGCSGEPRTGTYYVIFNEDVHGLGQGADVRCLGAPVGRVDEVRVLESNQVQAEISVVLEHVPMREDMRASVVVEEVGPYLKLTPGGKQSPSLKAGGTIPGEVKPSLPLAIEGLPEVLDKVDSLLGRFENAVGSPEQGVIADILRRGSDLALETRTSVKELRQLAGDVLIAVQVQIEENGKDFGQALGELQNTIQSARTRLDTLAEQSQSILEKIESEINEAKLQEKGESFDQTMEEFQALAKELQTNSANADELLRTSREAMERMESELQKTLRQAQEGFDAAEQLLKYLERDPSSLIHGKSGAGKP